MSNHTIVPIDQEISTITGTILRQHKSYSQFESIQNPLLTLNKQVSKSTIILTVDHLVNKNKISTFEKAKIQLEAILNDRIESLPEFIHNIRVISSEDISRRLNIHPFILQRLLAAIHRMHSNKSHDQSFDLNENNVTWLIRILNSTLEVKILIFFMMINENNDEYVTEDQLKQFMEIYLENLSFNNHRVSNAIEAFLQKFHHETKNRIDFEEFYSILTDDVNLLALFSRFSIDPNCFLTECSCSNEFSSHKTFYIELKSKLTFEYIRENLSKIIFLIFYISINLALALYACIIRRHIRQPRIWILLLRMSGMLLNFNCTLIVVLMFKQTILFIRSKKFLRRFIPIDSHLEFHKFVGRFIAVLAIIHTVACIIQFSLSKRYSLAVFLFTTKPGFGWVRGFTSLSGVILCIILLIMIICSMEFVRERAYFEIFYWTHTLYIVFYVFLIVHARHFWKWAIGPLVWLFLEKFYSFYKRYSPSSGLTYLISATIEPSNVIKLTIHRRKNFSFKPGDYVCINLPSIALYEFHPFTISSAPEQTDILQVHIQVNGNWTKRVYERFLNMSEDQNANLVVYRADRVSVDENNESMTTGKTKKERIIVNGPYSSCARYVFDCEHVILICTGIGVTPYASILSSLMAQFQSHENHRIKKVDFIWINRDYRNFEWFIRLLDQLEQKQEPHTFLDIHLYFTGVKTNPLIAFELFTRISTDILDEDMLTGLKSRTHFGRPQWNELFKRLKHDNQYLVNNDTSVFCCGPKVIRNDIRKYCIRYRFRYYEENF